jgi:hypothetical protein
MCSQKYTIQFFVLRTVFIDCCLTPIQQSSLPEIKTTLYATLALISSNYSLHMTENDWRYQTEIPCIYSRIHVFVWAQ